jgi:hypothetical protein
MYAGRAIAKLKMLVGVVKKYTVAEHNRNKKCEMVGQNKWTMIEQKLNKKCEVVGQKNVRRPG